MFSRLSVMKQLTFHQVVSANYRPITVVIIVHGG